MGDQDHIGENLRAYMQGFSPAVRGVFEWYCRMAAVVRPSPVLIPSAPAGSWRM